VVVPEPVFVEDVVPVLVFDIPEVFVPVTVLVEVFEEEGDGVVSELELDVLERVPDFVDVMLTVFVLVVVEEGDGREEAATLFDKVALFVEVFDKVEVAVGTTAKSRAAPTAAGISNATAESTAKDDRTKRAAQSANNRSREDDIYINR